MSLLDSPASSAPAQPGDRIRLISMGSDPDPVPDGTTGRVRRVFRFADDSWQISMEWDNGRSLALVWPLDKFEVIR